MKPSPPTRLLLRLKVIRANAAHCLRQHRTNRRENAATASTLSDAYLLWKEMLDSAAGTLSHWHMLLALSRDYGLR